MLRTDGGPRPGIVVGRNDNYRNEDKPFKAKHEEEVLPIEALVFAETVKEKVLSRLSNSDSKFSITARLPAGTDDAAAADETIGDDVEDPSTRKIVEQFLLDRVKRAKKKKGDIDERRIYVSRVFQLAQFYFEENSYEKAIRYFDKIKNEDHQALFQIGVMNFDGLGMESDPFEGVAIMRRVAGEMEQDEDDDSSWNKSSKRNKEKEKKGNKQKTGKQFAIPITSSITAEKSKPGLTPSWHLVPAAMYNIGTAYFQGFGVERQSDSEAERWWLAAAADGDPKGSVKAQTMLGIFYARRETLDLKKSFFWHSEACGNGSLESQGAVGVMYLSGLGVKKNIQSAFYCLKEAATRGNIYAMGSLVGYYYERQMFCLASDLGYKLSQLELPHKLARKTGCVPINVRKGIASACFYYARCLELGRGTKEDGALARNLYSKTCRFCPDVATLLQDKVASGEI